jgi:ferredoxin-NADP reductase
MSSRIRAAVPGGLEEGSLSVVVASIEEVAEGVNLYAFRQDDGGTLPAAEAGAHIDVFLPGGLVRQYSLLNWGPTPDHYEIAVKRQGDGRGGSRTLHDSLRVGAELAIGSPRNNFPLVEMADDTIFIAGGIGVTPLWSMAGRLNEIGRPWLMHYFCRSPADVIMPHEMRSRGERINTTFSGQGSRSSSAIADIVAAAPVGAHFYCCGPLTMLKDFEAATAHLPDDRVHVEYFTSDVEVTTEGGFMVELARSGLRLEVRPGQTIVQVVVGAGIDVLSQCTQGYCGTCETRVLSGTPDHRDVVLTRAEKASNTTMMICCSRSLTPKLVLDL